MGVRTILHFIPQTIIFSVLSIMAYIFIQDNKGNIRNKLKQFLNQRWIAFHIIYCAFLLTVTLIGRYKANPYTNIIGTFCAFKNGRLNSEIVVNILLYIPYTYSFIMVYHPKSAVLSCLFLSLITTCGIETLQLLFWLGQFSLADIVHNTIGGMLGYILWFIFHTGGERNLLSCVAKAIRKILERDR